jgi:hypothetical protein
LLLRGVEKAGSAPPRQVGYVIGIPTFHMLEQSLALLVGHAGAVLEEVLNCPLDSSTCGSSPVTRSPYSAMMSCTRSSMSFIATVLPMLPSITARLCG